MKKKTLVVGAKAPDFTLGDEQGNTHRLSDILKEHAVILVFYPGDMTPGCTIQLCGFRDDWQKFESLGVRLLGINRGSESSHAEFSKRYQFPFPLLSDPKLAVAKKYGAVRKAFLADIAKRTVVGISKDGMIRYTRHGMPKRSEILKAIKPWA